MITEQRKQYNKEYYQKNRDKMREYAKKRNAIPENREKKRLCDLLGKRKFRAEHPHYKAEEYRKYRENSPEKAKAQQLLNRNVKNGKIERPEKCEMCGSTKKVVGHHEDYEKPLEVMWVCTVCHSKIHLLKEKGYGSDYEEKLRSENPEQA